VVSISKKLTQFDAEKDEWYYQPKIYINPKSADPLYYDVVEFKSSLSREMSRKFLDNLDSMLEEENESEKAKTRKKINNKNFGLGKIINSNHKLRKPVISFFSDKARVIREEIDKIRKDAEARKAIHREFQELIQKDRKEIKRLLHEISLYAPGTKHSIDIRRLDLERELINLNKELRLAKLSLWKDLVFIRRELRELTWEMQALTRIAELVENGGNNGVAE